MLKIRPSATQKLNIKYSYACYESIEGGNFGQLARGVWKCDVCLASGHAGETDPVHGGAHQVFI
jgi:hypothetical protein